MNSFRESLASIPGALTNFIAESASSYMNLSTPSSSHSDESTTDRSLVIPASLIKDQWRLILNSDATISNLEQAIQTCKELVLNTDEVSEERKWLVRHLVELRYELKQLKDAEEDPNECAPSLKTVIGHHFSVRHVGRTLQNARTYCDHCTGIIWSVVQASYICNDCKFTVHSKCVDDILRVCAHVVVSERKYPIAEICPEVGLAAQGYKCAECQASLNFNAASTMRCFGQSSQKHESTWVEPRLCDYNGLYYCPSCHWNDISVIPARIIHNWDFVPRKVCRASLQEISLFLHKPVIKLEEANPKLFVFLQKLSSIKKLRENLGFMRKYLLECRTAMEEKLLDNQIGTRRYLLQSSNFYAISDLEQVESGLLYEFLNKVYITFDKHIRSCGLCTAKAYICEICSNDEVVFPFDDGCILCDKCNSIYHRVCITRKNMTCPKCVRLEDRKLLQTQELEDAQNGN